MCCVSATNSEQGTDVIRNKRYKPGEFCAKDDVFASSTGRTQAPDAAWEPELILWDYAANDQAQRFYESRSWTSVYHEFLTTALSLPTAPQVIILDNVFAYAAVPGFMGASDRIAADVAFCVPTLHYHGAAGSNLKEFSVWYATDRLNPHPQWPTHVLWAELAAQAILLAFEPFVSLDQPISSTIAAIDNSIKKCPFPAPPSNTTLTSGDKHPNKHNGVATVPADGSAFCSNGMASQKRFMGGSFDPTSMAPLGMPISNRIAGAESNRAPEINGWRFGKEPKVRDPTKTGWLFDIQPEGSVRSPQQDAGASRVACASTYNQSITFALLGCSSGEVEVGYISSYGSEWAAARISLFASTRGESIRSAAASASIASEVVDSQWSDKLSLVVHKRFKVRVPEARHHVPGRNDMILVSLDVCRGTGTKFKLVDVGCC
jgi:hypothetical protein